MYSNLRTINFLPIGRNFISSSKFIQQSHTVTVRGNVQVMQPAQIFGSATFSTLWKEVDDEEDIEKVIIPKPTIRPMPEDLKRKMKIFERQYKSRLRAMEEEKEAGISWRLVGATVVERYPKLRKAKEPWEEEYLKFKFERDNLLARDEEKNIEIMESELKSANKVSKRQKKKEEKKKAIQGETRQNDPDFESRQETEQQVSQAIPKRRKEIEKPPETYEEAKARLERMSPRITEDDLKNNRKSLNRALTEKLFLIVKKNRTEHAWQFPQGGIEEKETLRQCVERELTEECGDTLKLTYFSNAPSGCYAYKHNDEIKTSTGYYGTKVFFYRAYFQDGKIKLNQDELEDYMWVTKKELAEYLSPSLNELAQAML